VLSVSRKLLAALSYSSIITNNSIGGSTVKAMDLMFLFFSAACRSLRQRRIVKSGYGVAHQVEPSAGILGWIGTASRRLPSRARESPILLEMPSGATYT
jgi:hypothetical protein